MKREWHKLASYGRFSHRHGLQVIGEAEGALMVKKFYSNWGRLLKGDVNIYVGHPDDADAKDAVREGDDRVHGKVVELKSEADGLYGVIDWTPTGAELMELGLYRYFSPRWEMKKGEKGKWHPSRLLSVGLTNRPNLPMPPIAIRSVLSLGGVKRILGLDCGDVELADKLREMNEGASLWTERGKFATTRVGELETINERLKAQYKKQREVLIEQVECLANYLTEQLIEAGKILPSDRESYRKRFAQLAKETCELLSQKRQRALKTETVSNSIETHMSDDFLERVYKRMEQTGEGYPTAWINEKNVQ